MKQTSLLMLGLSTLVLTSCDTEIINQFPDLPDGQKSQLTVTGSVTERTASRASGSSWEEGDAIGIFSDEYALTKYVTTDGDGLFTSDSNPYYFANSKVRTFYAFYPYTSNVTNNKITFNVSTNANEAGQKANDFLWATGTASYSSPNLDLTFKHILTKVIITFSVSTEDGYDADDIFANTDNYKNSFMYMRTCNYAGEIDLTTGLVTGKTPASFQLKNPVDDLEAHTRTYTLLLPPQTTAKFELLLNLDVTGKDCETYGESLNSKNWLPGYTYTYNYVLKKKGLELASAYEIEDWGEGAVTDKDLTNTPSSY